jgi:hypothetical protein
MYLAAALNIAKSINLPKANVETAMKKGMVAAGLLPPSVLGDKKVEEEESLVCTLT